MRQYTSHERSANKLQTSRELRGRWTEAEAMLWEQLRSRRLLGLKFRRQHPVGRFIVDFYCAEAALVVELDGAVHDDPEERQADAVRQGSLEGQHLRVLRFRNSEVVSNIERVLTTITVLCNAVPTQAPPLHIVERGPGGEARGRSSGDDDRLGNRGRSCTGG